MKLLFTLSLSLLFSISFSQKNIKDEENPEILDSHFYELKSNPDSLKLRFPFEQIEIIDKRFDTSKIGYALKPDFFRAKKRAFTKMKLNNELSTAIYKFYNNTYQNNFTKTGYNLFIVIKTLWISAIPSSSNYSKVSVGMPEIDIHLKFEYYFKKDSIYIPLKRIDTVFQAFKKDTTHEEQENKIKFLAHCLKRMIETIDYLYYESSIERRTTKTFQQIENFNSQRSELPILRDSLKKGIYLSFDEFKNNNPSIQDFTIKLIVDKYVFLSADGTPIRNFWGYCDGKRLGYGTSGTDFLYRIGNTFQVFILDGVLRPVSLNLVALMPGSHMIPTPYVGEKLVWCPEELDMETGKLY